MRLGHEYCPLREDRVPKLSVSRVLLSSVEPTATTARIDERPALRGRRVDGAASCVMPTSGVSLGPEHRNAFAFAGVKI
jgi:hypothetical protein